MQKLEMVKRKEGRGKKDRKGGREERRRMLKMTGKGKGRTTLRTNRKEKGGGEPEKKGGVLEGGR